MLLAFLHPGARSGARSDSRRGRAVRIATPALLLTVFATHLPFFVWRYAKTRERRYLATALTFALLSTSYAFRVFAPEVEISGVRAFAFLRVPAWIAASVSLALLARHWLARARRRG